VISVVGKLMCLRNCMTVLRVYSLSSEVVKWPVNVQINRKGGLPGSKFCQLFSLFGLRLQPGPFFGYRFHPDAGGGGARND